MGADPDAIKNRIKELKDEILTYTDHDLTANSIIRPNEKLFENFSHYHVAAVKEIFKYAALDAPDISTDDLDNKSEGFIYSQIKFVYRELNIGRETFIFNKVGSSIGEAIKANYAMRRRSHWTLFLVVWLECGSSSGQMPRQKLIGEMWRRGVVEKEPALRNYITDLVTWGLLIRTDNTPRYAVSEGAREHFTEPFLSVG